MDIDGVLYCSKCMKRIAEETICPFCGYDHRGEGNKNPVLDRGTLLNGRYQLGSMIGRGGFGITYAAYDEVLQTPVAIKEYFPMEIAQRDTEESDEITVSEQNCGTYYNGLNHFIREARVLGMVKNMPGVVNVQDYFEENGTAYIVMEFLHGITLWEYARKNKIQPMELFEMLREPIQALIVLHKQGILHKDITPANLMLLENGSVKLIDFGSAAQMKRDQSMIVVTKQYAPLEQYSAAGQALGPWTDIYSLCATLYDLLTGEPPQDSLSRAQKDELIPLEKKKLHLKKYQIRAIMTGLCVEAEKRFQSMDEFYSRLYNLPLPEEIRRRKQFMRRIGMGFAGATILTVLCAFNFTTGLPLGNHVLMSLQGDGFHIYRSIGEETDLILPEKKLGIPVVSIHGNAFKNERMVKYVEVPGSIREIGSMAFYGCSSLETVKLQDGVEQIGEYTFANCPALRTVEVPESLLYLDSVSFDGASEYLTLWGQKGGEAERIVTASGMNFAARSDYDIQETGEDTAALVACRDADSDLVLPSVIDGKRITEIVKPEWESFFACEMLECLRFPEYLETIPDYLFSRVSSEKEQKVKKVILPPNLKSTGKCSFMSSGLEEVVLPDGLEVISEASFEATPLKEISIPDSVIRIEREAFYKTDLEKIMIPDSVQEIGISILSQCEELEEVYLPENLEYLPDVIMAGCVSLKEIHLPDGIREMGTSCFKDCRSLEYISIPSDIKEIPYVSFSECINLKYVYIPEGVEVIDQSAFEKCNSSLIIGGRFGSAAEKYANEHGLSFDAENLWDENVRFVESGTIHLTEQSGVEVVLPTYDKENDTLVKTVGVEGIPEGLKVVSFPKFAEKIEMNAFSVREHEGKSISLEQIVLPDTMKEIGDRAFLGCKNLQEVILPGDMEYCGYQAFEDCTGLQDVYIFSEIVPLFAYDELYLDYMGPFYNCPNLTIHGYKDSMAEICANKSGILFEALDKSGR